MPSAIDIIGVEVGERNALVFQVQEVLDGRIDGPTHGVEKRRGFQEQSD